MKLIEFPLLTDENIHADIVTYLRNLGFDVKDVKEENLQGSSDESLLHLAFKENRVIVTHDSDFGTIVFTKQTNFHGITYFRPGHIIASFTIKSIETLLNVNPDVTPPFILVVENQDSNIKIRIRNFSI